MVDNKLLYFVETSDGGTLLALDVKVVEEAENYVLTFFDTNRGRGFYGKLTNKDNTGFTFQTEQSTTMTFLVGTVEQFNKDWRWSVEGSVPDFANDNELHQWYVKTFLGD